MAAHAGLLHALGEAVRTLRRDVGWTRRDLAGQTGISERFLADIETGRANPSLAKLCDLAAALRTTPQALLGAAAAASGTAARRVIALLGLRGAGKSSVGRELAERLGCPFAELDAQVEAATGLSLSEVFQLHGETYYRRAERDALQRLLDGAERPLVLATGGGLVSEADTYAVLRTRAHTVWLRAAPEDHWLRVIAQGDTRPMADNEQAFTDLCAILAERERSYAEADLIVDTSQREVGDIARELALHFAFLATGAA